MGADGLTNNGFNIVQLSSDLRTLGVTPGDLLFVHSSFKSLGIVDGGAETVVASLEKVLGTSGLLLMPSFNLMGDVETRANNWDREKTVSTVGWLTEYFRQMPGTHRSDHYSHAVAARGVGAEAFVSDHLSNEGLSSPWDRSPWGKCYGRNSPMIRACERDGKVLMLGVDYESSTYVHVVEVMYWDERLKMDPDADYVWLHRENLGKVWDLSGLVTFGNVGHANCRLFGIRAFVDYLLDVVKEDPDLYARVKLRKASSCSVG